MVRTSSFAAFASLTLLLDCAGEPQQVAVSSVPQLTYQNYTCDQVAADVQRVTARIDELNTAQNQSDAAGTAVAIATAVLLPIWVDPGDDGHIAAELKQQQDVLASLQEASAQKKCEPPAQTAATTSK